MQKKSLETLVRKAVENNFPNEDFTVLQVNVRLKNEMTKKDPHASNFPSTIEISSIVKAAPYVIHIGETGGKSPAYLYRFCGHSKSTNTGNAL